MAKNGESDHEEKAHFVLVPVMAQGHTIPMLDMARLLAGRGAFVTFVTTPLNFARIKSLANSGLPVHFLPLRFPCAECGLPDGCEVMLAEERRADGIVVNTFDDLEASYVNAYGKITEKKIWTLGPLSLCNRGVGETAARGSASDVDVSHCLRWLDSKKHGSVVYVSFGSLSRTMPGQLIQVGLGLEASERPFVWVIKAGDRFAEVEEWLKAEGFEERVKDRGLIINGWAPQVAILSHPAVGGFMTHCGWNSTLEGVVAGLPMITWPHFAEQFLNEKLIVDSLKIGAPVGVQQMTLWGAENAQVLIEKDVVETAVGKLMDEGKEGEERRTRARELAEKARRAMEEGGSSYENTKLLIREIQAKNMHAMPMGS